MWPGPGERLQLIVVVCVELAPYLGTYQKHLHYCLQVGDIGLMGAPAKKDGKACEGFKIFTGGKIGENPELAKEFAQVSVNIPNIESCMLCGKRSQFVTLVTLLAHDTACFQF